MKMKESRLKNTHCILREKTETEVEEAFSVPSGAKVSMVKRRIYASSKQHIFGTLHFRVYF